MHKGKPFGELFDAHVVCAFSLRFSGNTSLYYGDTRDSLDNRTHFLKDVGIDYQDIICAKQVHGNNVKYVTEKDKGSGACTYETSIPDTDSFITDTFNLPIAMLTADCLCVFLYDLMKPAIAVVHAGWRSTQKKVLTKTLESMQEKFGTLPENVYAAFGPRMRGCCYEVGDEFKTYFTCGLTEKHGRQYLDLGQVNKNELFDFGVKEENIFDSERCTSCHNTEFFSFRREGKYCGRTMSVIMMK
ncbi:MAG: peptidoglycan editing factor PgeF [Candidatus Omnitrophica bacterium]|nr:peptidoglycan editing factor PgeF [Candidatus Omnitrophota bacterium]